MTRTLLLAALALACVLPISPVFAAEGSCAPELSDWPWYVGLVALAFCYIAFDIWREIRKAEQRSREWASFLRKPCWFACIACGAAAIVLLGPATAFAQAVTDPAANSTVILPYGEWIVAAANTAAAVLIPALVAFLIKAVTSVYPWAALFLTQRRVEQMANAVTEYAINAVPGAVKEGKLSVNLGMEVIAKAVQYAVDAAPGRAMEAAGGPEGLAKIVFRKLNLDDRANEANTLVPALAAMQAK